MSKSSIIDQILSLMKENGISNREILQNNINVNNDNTSKVTICCLVLDEAYNKYKQYMKNNTINTITGNRYYYYGTSLYDNVTGSKAFSGDQVIPYCGYVNDASVNNLNKPGFQQTYRKSEYYKNTMYEENKSTYLKFTRPILQNSKNTSFGLYNQVHVNPSLVNYSKTIEFSIGEIDKMYYGDKSLANIDLSDSVIVNATYGRKHYFIFQQLATFVPCFKI